jgi:hypothetical protein
MVWRMVLLDAICTIMPRPVSNKKNNESHKVWDSEKEINPNPKILEATAMTLPNPITLFREARKMAPITAPTPIDPIRKPYVIESPRRMSLAKTGISVEVAIPTQLIHPRKKRIVRMGGKPKA